ncbi:hypothetical protein B0H12DRAFT_588674 [Mycena haematopus]|nr:hypothetical protein B0H12DRAFT_588674 [Mycena haematopus]
MFTSIVFTAILTSSAVLLSQAIVEPNEPGPGESFNEGTTCHIAWDGDTTSGSATAWKNMAIQLMTGPNNPMVNVTTVATGLDGTVAGTYDYTCPQVTPNAPIYFYQFTSGGTPNITWTTRFTIAGADGSSVNATQSEQADGQTVFFGTGALVDPSTAVPPPTFNSTSSSSSGSSDSSNLPSVPNSSSGSSNPSSTGGASKTSASASASGSSSSASSPAHSGSSAAVAVGPMDTRVWPFVAALAACAMTFTILL